MSIYRRILMAVMGAFVMTAPFLISGCVVHDDQWHHDHGDWHDDHGWHSYDHHH